MVFDKSTALSYSIKDLNYELSCSVSKEYYSLHENLKSYAIIVINIYHDQVVARLVALPDLPTLHYKLLFQGDQHSVKS